MGETMKGRVARILVLGGDPDAGEELMHILTREGFMVEVAASLAAGMRLLDGHMFSVVLLDLSMFRGNEKVLIEQIEDKDRELAIMAIGELPTDSPDIRSIIDRVASYQEKPVGKDRLVSSLKNVVQESGLHRSDRESLLSTIGERIRAERKKQSLTLKQVADRTKLSVSLLSQIERAESAASVSSLYKIANALSTPLQSFFEGY
jgi:DNA-binding NtrC family response regulator